jgi:hypothetical protein
MTSTPLSSPAFTRGPWSFRETSDGNYRITGQSQFPDVAEVYYRDTEAEQLANASLVSTAPDLYDACRLAIDSMKDALDGTNPGWMDDMRADLACIEKALAKANKR